MSRIAIIGGGVIGLTTAIQIQKEISDVYITLFTEKLSPYTTGDVSAGLWTPYLLENTPLEDVMKWSKVTLDYALDLWKSGKAEEAGISLAPAINLTSDDKIKVPEWSKITIGAYEFNKDQLKKLSVEHKRNYKAGFTYLAVMIEPSKFLPMIQEEFLKKGGTIVMRKIKEFDELKDYDVIVNCTGLFSKILASDEKMKPIRGQVARVRAPWQFHTISFDDHYIIPNIDCVILGGTHQEEDDLLIRNADVKFIIKGCQDAVPSLKNATLIKHQVGLRPGREKVRLELETKRIDDKMVKIVHNYGHGGSGVTLSIGCAKDACDLVKSTLNLKSKL